MYPIPLMTRPNPPVIRSTLEPQLGDEAELFLLSYTRLVQPVLDRHCVGCHDGAQCPGKSQPALTGEPSGSFTKSYEALCPHVRWYEWGKESIAHANAKVALTVQGYTKEGCFQ